MKKTYMIIYNETLTHHFYVDAENEYEAEAEFAWQASEGKIDFSDGEVTDTDMKIVEVCDDGFLPLRRHDA